MVAGPLAAKRFLFPRIALAMFIVVPGLSAQSSAAPAGLSATPGNQEVTLRWAANSEVDLHKYNIFRDTSPPATTLVDSTTGAGMLHSQTSLPSVAVLDFEGRGVSQPEAQTLTDRMPSEIGKVLHVWLSGE